MFRLLSGSPLLIVRVAGLTGLVSVLAACQSVPEQTEPEAPPVQVQVEPTPPPLTEQQKHINAMLADADYSLSQNRLLNPINDNAHDRYRSVLLMDPDNARAKEGLQIIALRYVDLARTAATRGNIGDAQSYIKYARGIDNNPVVQDAAETLRKQIASIPAPKPYQPGENEHVLDAKLLQAKDPEILNQLVGVAQKAKATDEFVLIVARSDSEGRWIYQQLRNAVPGYLVRGDIKIGQPARVKLVKSLD